MDIRLLPLLAPLLTIASAPPLQPQPGPDEQVWFGAQLAGVALDDSAAAISGRRAGVHLVRVVNGGPCHRSGFATGDILLALDTVPFGNTPEGALAGFMERLGKSAVGDRLALEILRPTVIFSGTRNGEETDDAAETARHFSKILDGLPPGSSLAVSASKKWHPLLLVATIGQRPGTSGARLSETADLFPGGQLRSWPHVALVEKRLATAALEEDQQDLLARLARLAERGDASRSHAMTRIHRRPFALPQLADYLARGFEERDLARRSGAGLGRLLEHAAATEGLAPLPVQDGAPPPPVPGLAPEALLDILEQHLEYIAALREASLARLSATERTHGETHWRSVIDRFEDDIYLYNDADSERAARNEQTLRIGEKVDRQGMLATAVAALPLVMGDWLDSLQADLEAAGLDTSLATVLERQTSLGRIRIAGTGDDFHRRGDQFTDAAAADLDALLIDLGGDDLHTAGGTTTNALGRPVLPASILIDLAGNDAYEGTQDGSQGAGVLGLGVVRDLAGDDRYTAGRWCQGAGWMGVGILLDEGGDDRFNAQTLAQGIGAWGLGLLVDSSGQDSYRALRYGQAVGLAGGTGVLADRAGADEYYCKGRWPTGYGTPGVFEGWGQGCGIGFRGNASGGVGLLIDGAGKDIYEAGNFAQGGGYYFGFGALFDRGRDDDLYIGSRYNQAFSAHQAAGFFLEEGGDDNYETRNSVAHGLAWDESVSFFIDERGDDRYRGGGFSLGASAHNGICVFHERNGRDTYLREGEARAGGNDYHGGTSLSIFLEEGGDDDAYAGEDRNNQERLQPEHGVFIDR